MTLLTPMTADDYLAWRAEAIPGYARDKVTSGQWSEEESLAQSRAELDELLPLGRGSPGHHLWSIRAEADGDTLGTLWIEEQRHGARRVAYVFDFVVLPAHRRQGHARRAFLALEDKVRELGVDGISLHVFGHNAPARALYESLGYAATNITMFKPLR